MSLIDTRRVSGKKIVLSVYLRAGANFSAPFVSLEIIGTTSLSQQSITLTAGTYTTGNTSLGASNVTVSNISQRHELSVDVPQSITQVAIRLAFSPTGTAGANDYLDIEKVQLEIGDTASDYLPVDSAYAELKALKQYRKSYSYQTAPGSPAEYSGAMQGVAVGTVAGKALRLGKELSPNMEASPTVALYSPQTGAIGKMAQSAVADIDALAVHISTGGFAVYNNAAAVNGEPYFVHYTASAAL